MFTMTLKLDERMNVLKILIVNSSVLQYRILYNGWNNLKEIDVNVHNGQQTEYEDYMTEEMKERPKPRDNTG